MATPFSPFVGKIRKPVLKRRQSQVPSDLIDWDAPEIPELDKQRIIYEDQIKELNEDHDIESVLNEQIFLIAHQTIVDHYKSLVEGYRSEIQADKNEISKEKNKVNLLLGQLKMFESDAQEYNGRSEELERHLREEKENNAKLHKIIDDLTEEKNNLLLESKEKDRILEVIENLTEEKSNLLQDIKEKEKVIEELTERINNLQQEIENLQFKNNETTCELNHHLELYMQKKSEAEEMRRTLTAVKNQLAHYKKLAKNKNINNDD